MLQDADIPIITQVDENFVNFSENPFSSEEKIVFPHNGLLSHYRKDVSDYFGLNYPNRWIFRLASYSIDLAPSVLFFCGGTAI